MTLSTDTSDTIAPASASAAWVGGAALLAVWFLTILALAVTGVMDPGPGRPPLPILIAIAVPTLAFLGAYRALPGFQSFVLNADLRLITALHAWRTIGFGFILLHLNGLLPGLFAWPAGVGDFTIAIIAPWMVYRLMRDPNFVKSNRYVWWNRLGILDFVIAVATGAATSGAFPALVADGTTSAAMSTLPLAMIPGFFVPLFILLHLTALLQAAAARRGEAS